jgi:hypothetical protein
MSLVYGVNGETLGIKDHANFDSDPDDSKSQYGYVCTVNVGEVSGRSKKETTTAQSTMESEYMALQIREMKLFGRGSSSSN